MKKLMFAAAALAAGFAFADGTTSIVSANIVGYQQVDRQSKRPTIGASFIPVDGATTYKLGEIKVVSDDYEEAFDPDAEYFQLLDENTTEVTARYTCLTTQMADLYEELEEYDLADLVRNNLGWWDYTAGKTLENIEAGTATKRDDEVINVGKGFLLMTSNVAKRQFTFAGMVPQTSKAIETQAKRPLIANFRPVDCTLGQITVESGDAEEAFDPDAEYFQVLDADTTEVTKRYTCLTTQMADLYEELEEYDLADLVRNNLGWWDYTAGKTLENIEAGTAASRDDVVVHPGDAFLLMTSDVAKRMVNIPAVEVK